MVDNFSKRVEKLVVEAGGQNALARKSGLSLGAIQRYLKGGEPTRGALIKLAIAGSVDTEWLTHGTAGTKEHRIPLFGFAEEAQAGWYMPEELEQAAALHWPDPDIFAVSVLDNNLKPAGLLQGQTALTSPNTAPRKDDIVYLKNKEGYATLRVVSGQDKDWLTTKCWLDGETEMVDRYRIEALEMIAPVIFIKRR